jgi:MFS family permease
LRRRTLIVFIILSLVSLTADMVYEGARSVGGSYIEELGGPPVASATIASGDLIGYGLRFVSAVIATYLASSSVFWGIIIFGYALQLFAMPTLAFAYSWSVATALYLIERVGKGLRTPLRDVVLAEVTEDIGMGKGFGIHELMDQAGAVAGPLLVAFMISLYGYRSAFLALAIPGTISIALVLTAFALYPKLKSLEASRPSISFRGLGRKFYVYTLATILLSLGYVHWMNVSYFLKYWRVLGDADIALAYMVAMLTDAITAVPIGALYDKIKFKSLYLAPLSGLVSTILFIYTPTFMGAGEATARTAAYVMATLWGVTMGCFETIMRASIADLLPPEKRALGYGVYGLVYGASWAIGSFIYVYLLLQPQPIPAIYATTTLLLSSILISRI